MHCPSDSAILKESEQTQSTSSTELGVVEQENAYFNCTCAAVLLADVK